MECCMMKDEDRTKEQLLSEVRELRDRVARLHAVEAERKKVEEALRESEVKFRTQFHLSPQPIAITEAKTGRLIDVNDKYCELTRYERANLIGRTTPELGFYPQGDRDRLVRELESSGEARGLDMQLKIKGGTILTVLMFARVIKIEGEPYILNLVVDVTERRRLRAQLEQARKMEAIVTLAAGIAHEFNNALTGIIGNLDLLELALPGNHQAGNYLQPMKSSAFRMARLTSQLLAYAREGKYQTRLLSLSDFVEDLIPVVRHGIDAEIRVETDLPHHVSPVEADPTQMQMVLSAVVANAAEAIEGKGRIRISTGHEEITEKGARQHPDLTPGLYVRLRVEDDGKGMDENTRARMFEPFFTTKFHGRGLGMAAVYGIIKNHNGSIEVDSEQGKGTVVRIYLPAAGGSDKATDKDSR
jgi:PAS domain S-box-containing protein